MEGPQTRKPLGKTRMVVSFPQPQFAFNLMGMVLVCRRQPCEAVIWLGCAEAGEHQRRQGNSPSHTPNWYTDSILVLLISPSPPLPCWLQKGRHFPWPLGCGAFNNSESWGLG